MRNDKFRISTTSVMTSPKRTMKRQVEVCPAAELSVRPREDRCHLDCRCFLERILFLDDANSAGSRRAIDAGVSGYDLEKVPRDERSLIEKELLAYFPPALRKAPGNRASSSHRTRLRPKDVQDQNP